MELKGKVALVTGGASGIGRAASEAFAREGAAVVLTYITSGDAAAGIVAAIHAKGGRALALKADMSVPAEVDQVFAAADKAFGPPDAVFANAGGILGRSRLVDASPDFWHQAIAINLMSTVLTCQAALKRMEPRKSGAIVTMASQAAFDGGGHGASHYAATKGAIVTFTRSIAKEVGPLGIRVNSVAPGLIATRFHDIFNTPEGRKMAVERTPLRREGTSEDVAEAVVYLCSDRAAFITGEVLQINGGQLLV